MLRFEGSAACQCTVEGALPRVSRSPQGWSGTPLAASQPKTSTVSSGKHNSKARVTELSLTEFLEPTATRSFAPISQAAFAAVQQTMRMSW